MEGLTFQHLYE